MNVLVSFMVEDRQVLSRLTTFDISRTTVPCECKYLVKAYDDCVKQFSLNAAFLPWLHTSEFPPNSGNP
jgi:hypothetical protein